MEKRVVRLQKKGIDVGSDKIKNELGFAATGNTKRLMATELDLSFFSLSIRFLCCFYYFIFSYDKNRFGIVSLSELRYWWNNVFQQQSKPPHYFLLQFLFRLVLHNSLPSHSFCFSTLTFFVKKRKILQRPNVSPMFSLLSSFCPCWIAKRKWKSEATEEKKQVVFIGNKKKQQTAKVNSIFNTFTRFHMRTVEIDFNIQWTSH